MVSYLFCLQGDAFVIEGFAQDCGRPYSVGDLCDGFLWWNNMASIGKIDIEKFNSQKFELWKLKLDDLLVDKDQWIMVDPGTKPMKMSLKAG